MYPTLEKYPHKVPIFYAWLKIWLHYAILFYCFRTLCFINTGHEPWWWLTNPTFIYLTIPLSVVATIFVPRIYRGPSFVELMLVCIVLGRALSYCGFSVIQIMFLGPILGTAYSVLKPYCGLFKSTQIP